MGGRRESREWALQFLFQQDFNREELDTALEDFWSDKKVSPKWKAFTEEMIKGVLDHQLELDQVLQSYADNWDVERMAAVDRNVMRLALYEMKFRPDIPPVVSINEAVDIAKDFSSRESGRFVNGILDRICKDLDRPSRTPDIPTASEGKE